MCCKGKRKKDDAVSELVGEMLMLTIVLIMMAVFASSASDVLPPARDPSVSILQDKQENYVYLYHKGGDAIPWSELRVVVDGVDKKEKCGLNGSPADPNELFDLGGYIYIPTSVAGTGSHIKLATSRAVIWTGVVT
jgi:FlaG/FlaF family flagellin (archaellin)